MDIRDIGARTTRPPEGPRPASGVGPTPAAGSTPNHADRVTLSQQAQALQELRRAAADVPDVRTDRVDAVRAKLEEGALAPDPQRIARALLEQGIVRF